MPKPRRRKQRTVNNNETESAGSDGKKANPIDVALAVATAAKSSGATSGVDIGLAVASAVNDPDTKLTKKERRAKRRNELLERLSMAAKQKADAEKPADYMSLDDLTASLMELQNEIDEENGKKTRGGVKRFTRRKRNRIQQTELEQMKLVFEHPAFQADPLDAVAKHLMNTTAASAAAKAEKLALDKRAANKVDGKKKKKKKSKKPGAGDTDMGL